MELKVLGICGSPVKGGNTETFLREALKAAEEIEGVRTELVTLAGREIADCRHCNWCVTGQEEGKFCANQDDMMELYPKMLEADALLLATPVYFGRLSGYLASVVDRLRAFLHARHYRGALRNKVGGALAVGWFRNGGGETALISLVSALLALGMIPVNPGVGHHYGAVGLASYGGMGKFDPKDRLGVLKDGYGLRAARGLGKRVVEITCLLKAGREALRTS